MTLKCHYEVKMTFYDQIDGFIGFRRSKPIGNEVLLFNTLWEWYVGLQYLICINYYVKNTLVIIRDIQALF